MDAINSGGLMRPRMVCPYCASVPEKVTGREIYPRMKRLWDKKFILCRPCDAYVGCHNDPDPKKWKPLGSLANRELRGARIDAHRMFDRMWRDGQMHRSSAYTWLAGKLGIEKRECHIGMFNLEMCNKVITIMEEYYGRTKGKKVHRQKDGGDNRRQLADEARALIEDM